MGVDDSGPVNSLVPLTDADRVEAQKLSICPEIHVDDFLFHFLRKKSEDSKESAAQIYYNSGYHSANLLKNYVLPEIGRLRRQFGFEGQLKTLIDFASGYGCLARHFLPVLPELQVIACDIHEKANHFNSTVLGISTVQSSAKPAEVRLPSADIMLALSFFSHMPARSFRPWLQALNGALPAGGALIFTTRGHFTHTVSPADVVLDRERGFGFLPHSEQKDLPGAEYGTSVVLPHFVATAVRDCAGIRLSVFREALWWGHQDLYICFKA